VIEAGKFPTDEFPTDETDEKIQASKIDYRVSLPASQG